MESEFQQQQQQRYHIRDHHQKQTNSGLARYQSAPSSYFSSFGDRDSLEEFLHRPTSPETERILSGFLQSSDGSSNVDSFLDQSFSRQNTNNNSLTEKKEKQPEIKIEKQQTEFPVSIQGNYEETNTMLLKPSCSASVSQNLSQDQRLQGSDDRSVYRTMGSSLARHNSSPAGFFSSIDVKRAYAAVTRSMGENANTGNKEASSLTPRSRLPPSPSRLMTPISETDTKPCSSPGIPPRTLSGGLKRSPGIDNSVLNALSVGDRTLSGGLNLSETKGIGTASRPPLSHHRSLPKSLSDMEKLLSDSVPCKIRAKRGCATHPRSIAERVKLSTHILDPMWKDLLCTFPKISMRLSETLWVDEQVRRTKISERMKRLQDLVPNMDKQTNTADMLDLAVDYIKDLQRQVAALLDCQSRCTCSSRWP